MPNIEQIIQDAISRGEFENLRGAGKPIYLSAYFDTPEEIRVAYSILKSADILPQEAELLKEITTLKDAVDAEQNVAKKKRLLKTLDDKQLAFDLLMERQKRMKKAGL